MVEGKYLRSKLSHEATFSGFVQYLGDASLLGLTQEQLDALKDLADRINPRMVEALMEFEQRLKKPQSFFGKIMSKLTENRTSEQLCEDEDCLTGPEWRSNHAVVVLIYDHEEEVYFFDLYCSNLHLLYEVLKEKFPRQLGPWRLDDTVVFMPKPS